MTTRNQEVEDTDLARSALFGVASNWFGSIVLVAAQVASTALTARYVSPREFGVYATAQAGAGFAGYLTMNAIGGGLQRRSRLGAKTVGTAVTVSLASSLLVALGVWFGASPWARAWGVPDAAKVLRVIAIALFLTSAATVPVALIRRRLRFGAAALVETGAQVAGVTAGVFLAIHLHSALALALGQAIGAITLLAAAATIARRELRLAFDLSDARELLTFAVQVGILGFGSYATNTAPSWFAARVFGASFLGVYSRASLIVGLPLTYVLGSITKVLYPLYGRVREDLTRTKTLLEEGLTLTTGFVWPMFSLLAGASPVVVRVLLGERWHAAGQLVALSALIACGGLSCGVLTNAAEAFGWMRVVAARQMSFLVGVAAVMFIVHLAQLSMNSLLIGVALCQWVTYGLTLAPFVARRFLDVRLLVRRQLVHAAVAAASFAAAAGCAQVLAGASAIGQVAGQLGVAAVVCSVLIRGRAWFPATQVLAYRTGHWTSGSGLLPRIGAAVLR